MYLSEKYIKQSSKNIVKVIRIVEIIFVFSYFTLKFIYPEIHLVFRENVLKKITQIDLQMFWNVNISSFYLRLSKSANENYFS